MFAANLSFSTPLSNIITVGTNDCKFYYKEKEIESPYKINVPLIKLQDGHIISQYMKNILKGLEINQ